MAGTGGGELTMAVYRILIKKRVQSGAHRTFEWSNTYTVVSMAPFSRDETRSIADTVAPRLVEFERYFHIEDVQFWQTQTTPIVDPPVTNVFVQLPFDERGRRPIALHDSAGPTLTLLLGFEPLRNHWGKKDYRYAVGKDEYDAMPGEYRLRPESLAQFQATVRTAKTELQPLLQADSQVPSLVVSATTDEHLLESYTYRYIRNVIVQGIHTAKQRRR